MPLVFQKHEDKFSHFVAHFIVYFSILTAMANYKAGLASVMFHGIIPKGIKDVALAQTSEHEKTHGQDKQAK